MKRLSILICMLVLAGCAQFEQKPYEISALDLHPYAEFVERHTGYNLNPLPRVVVNQRELRIAYANTSSIFTYIPRAMYERGVMYIDHTRFNLNDAHSLSSLVHELVHHGQYLAYVKARAKGPEAERSLRNQKGWICNASAEREAHAITIEWARSVDVSTLRRLERVNIAAYADCASGWTDTLFFAD